VADRFLSRTGDAGRFAGSIRLPVTNVPAALEEIRTWADDPRFVQVSVPMRTFVPYGDDTYLPVWEAAAELGLSVAVYDDYATGVAHPESPVGAVRYFAEKFAATPFSDIIHLTALITCGTFDRVPDLRFIFADASVDLARVMLWRLEKDWRSGRVEIPWVERIPSQYAAPHLRFVTHPEDGVGDGEHVSADLLGLSDAEHLVLFGSHFPYWDAMDAKTVLDQWPAHLHERVLSQNALEVMPRLAHYLRSQPTT
jgi:predicted TIM-barrel fold metal-dependent hydrolase